LVAKIQLITQHKLFSGDGVRNTVQEIYSFLSLTKCIGCHQLRVCGKQNSGPTKSSSS